MEVVTQLSTGAYFGEVSLLKLGPELNRRNADVRSVGYSELLCLSRRELNLAIVEYPDTRNVLEEIATKRQNAAADKKAIEARPAIQETSLKSSSKLASVIKSDSFRTMVNKRRTELGEMRDLINQMKELNSKVSSDLITRQTAQEKEIKHLRRKLSKRKKIQKELRRNSFTLYNHINGNARGVELRASMSRSFDSDSDRSMNGVVQRSDHLNGQSDIASTPNCPTDRRVGRAHSLNLGSFDQGLGVDSVFQNSDVSKSPNTPTTPEKHRMLGVPRVSIRKSRSFDSSGSFDLEDALASMSHLAMDDAFNIISSDAFSDDEDSDSDLDSS